MVAVWEGVSYAADKGLRYETPITKDASEVLPPHLVAGPHYRVRSRVITYGYLHHYIVDSDFGVFEVVGDYAFRKLIKEIQAIAVLSRARKSPAYKNALDKGGSQPIVYGSNLITNPVGTSSGVPHGLVGFFQNVRTGITSKPDPVEQRMVEQIMTVSSNKRDLAYKLGVDVYSSNATLQKELNGIAWAMTLGAFSLAEAVAMGEGPASAPVLGSKTALQATDLLKEYPQPRLREINFRKLEAMGVSSELAGRFLELSVYTPTHATFIACSLEALSGAKGRDLFLELALPAQTEDTANYIQNTAEILRWYHLRVSPIQLIAVYGPFVFAKAANGTVLLPLAIDHGYWTEWGAKVFPNAMTAFKASHGGGKRYEMWLTGTLSNTAKLGLAKHGIHVVERVVNRVEFAY